MKEALPRTFQDTGSVCDILMEAIETAGYRQEKIMYSVWWQAASEI